MQIPLLDDKLHLEAIETLVDLERDWCPHEEGTALYIRPTVVASEPHLGVRPAKEFIFYIILCAVGAYFDRGFTPVKIAVTRKYVRAAPGGTGFAKTAGNYAASLAAQAEAISHGCDQVLFLDAAEFKYVEELGGMNFFACFDDVLVTPPLLGTILPGVTRDSIIALAHEMGVKVEERKFSADELVQAIKSGKCREAFASGTAAVVTSVGSIYYEGEEVMIGDGNPGPLSQRLYRAIVDIQRGIVHDKFGWTRICPRK
jgi:branched-chain amino acid aminotransferase